MVRGVDFETPNHRQELSPQQPRDPSHPQSPPVRSSVDPTQIGKWKSAMLTR